MNELNDKAINICQAIIGFKLGVSDDEINQAIFRRYQYPHVCRTGQERIKKKSVGYLQCKSGYIPDSGRT